RVIDGTPLGGVKLGHRRGAGGIRTEAVDRFRREGDQSAGAQDPRRAAHLFVHAAMLYESGAHQHFRAASRGAPVSIQYCSWRGVPASVFGKRSFSSSMARSETSHFPSMQEVAIIPEELKASFWLRWNSLAGTSRPAL